MYTAVTTFSEQIHFRWSTIITYYVVILFCVFTIFSFIIAMHYPVGLHSSVELQMLTNTWHPLTLVCYKQFTKVLHTAYGYTFCALLSCKIQVKIPLLCNRCWSQMARFSPRGWTHSLWHLVLYSSTTLRLKCWLLFF